MQRRRLLILLSALVVLPLKKIFARPAGELFPTVSTAAGADFRERCALDLYGEPPRAFYDLVDKHAAWGDWNRSNNAFRASAAITSAYKPLCDAYPHIHNPGKWSGFYAIVAAPGDASYEQIQIIKREGVRSLHAIARKIWLNIPPNDHSPTAEEYAHDLS